jgi:thioredoxin 1
MTHHHSIHHFSEKDDFDKFIKKHKFVVVDFFADWCGPCKNIAPKFDKWSEEYTSVKFCKINVDEAQDITANAGVRAMPTFHFFKDGKKVSEVVGANAGEIEKEIKKLKEVC